MRVGMVTIGCIALTLAVASCGGSDDENDLTAAAVQACLEDAGFGVTVIPAEEVAEGAEHNRGPGQTGELLVGAEGAEPDPGADESEAIVAFWDSADSAVNAPGVGEPGIEIDVFGTISVQPTGSEQRPEVEEIESCVQ
jgi:hypothetical protein